MVEKIQILINAWSVPFFMGWSIMKIFKIMLILTVIPMVTNYFWDTAKR